VVSTSSFNGPWNVTDDGFLSIIVVVLVGVGHSPVCDSYVRPETLVRICDECNFGTYGGRCIICGSPGEDFSIIFPLPHPTTTPAIGSLGGSSLTHIRVSSSHLGISDAYYCAECTRLEKDRDGCPKIVNLGASRTDLFYERRRLGAFVLRTHYFSFVYV
jgi:PHF5-like protein